MDNALNIKWIVKASGYSFGIMMVITAFIAC